MPQTVEIPDQGIAEFPDDMTPDQIKGVIQQKFYSQPAQPQYSDGSPTGEELNRMASNAPVLENAVQAAGDLVKGAITSIPGAVYQAAKLRVAGPQERAQMGAGILRDALAQGKQTVADVESPLGTRESFRGLGTLAMAALPALEIARELRPPTLTKTLTAPPVQKGGLSDTLGFRPEEPQPEGVIPNASQIEIATPTDGGVRTRSEVGELPQGNVEATNARLRSDIGEEPAQARQGVEAQPPQETVAPTVPQPEQPTGSTPASEEHTLAYVDAEGRDAVISASPEDLQSAADHIKASGGEVHAIDGKIISKPVEEAISTATGNKPVSGERTTKSSSGEGGTPSWILRNKETGEVVMETFDPKKVAALNTEKYEAVPVHDYLGELNKKKGSAEAAQPAPRSDVGTVGQPETGIKQASAVSPYDEYAGITKERALELDTKNGPSGYARKAIAKFEFDKLTPEEQQRVIDYQRREVDQAEQSVKDAYTRGKRGTATNKALGLPNKGISGGRFEAHKDAIKYQKNVEAELADLIARQKPADTGARPVAPPVEPPEKIVDGVVPEKQVVTGSSNPEQARQISPQALGVTHPTPNFIKSVSDYFVNNTPSQIWNSIRGSIDATLGKTFAKTTIADRQAGELGAKWISSRIAAPHLADTFSAQVLEGTGVDPVKFGAALTEDNLRSVRASAETPQAAADVTSIVGAKNSPFKTEAEYQSFLSDPAVQKVIERHRALWAETIDPMFRKAQSLDPGEPLPTRGEQTDARINLFNDVEGRGKNIVGGGRTGNLTATFRRKSPFAIRAKGTGQSYNVNYNDMMANTFGRQLEIANKNAFEDRLVETGNAVIGKPGSPPTLPDGETTVGFPLKRKASAVFTNTEGQPQTVPVTQNIYVRKSLAGEYRRGADVDLLSVPGAVKSFNNAVNKAALAGLTDASVHVLNLNTALLTRPSITGSVLQDSLLSTFGRADVPVAIGKFLVKGFRDKRAQMAQLSEIGAARGEFPTKNPLGKVIQWADKTTRLVMDDAYQSMVKQGLVEDTPTNRREFVNQVGQYNKRAQGDLRRLARDSGLGPFATAGTTFNTLGLRTLGLSPGLKATSPMAAAALRANVLSKWIGAFVFTGTLNYLLTKDKGGGVTGRPGVPIGRIDTGMNDKNGNPLSFPLFDVLGLGRALRVTGARGLIESQRKGLSLQNSFDAAARDAINTNISPFLGPPVRFGSVAATGQQPAINVGRVSKVVPPGESQTQENIKQAIIDANPVMKSIALAQEPGQGMAAAIRQQIPRLSLLPSQSAEFMSKYPEIVRKAQARDFVNDVIHRARRMNPEDKQQFLDEALQKLSPEDRKQALRTFKYSRVMGEPRSGSVNRRISR